MPITKAISSKTNTKQLTNADSPNNPNQVVTAVYGPVASTAGQTVINLSFAVNTSATSNFFLYVDGKLLSLGAGNDYTFTSIQANGTSSQVTLNQSLPANLNIQAFYLGVVVPTFSLSTLTASVNTLTASTPANQLINGGFEVWQRGTSTTIANGATTGQYQADRWYAKNSLGTSGILTYSQTAGANTGSKFGASLQITTAPTASQANGCELYQTLENLNTIPLLNQTLSFSCLIKGLNNVTSIGLQFYYATTEIKVTTPLGSEQSVTVTNSGFVSGKLQGIAIGTLPTNAGSIGVRIRILGVSSGNTYDISNGFVVEQAMMNIGATAANFARAGRNYADEFAMCLRYCEVFGLSAASGRPMAMGTVISSGSNQFIIAFAGKKRVNAVATCNSASSFVISNGTNTGSATGFSDNGCGVDAGSVIFTATSTSVNASTLLTQSVSTGRIFFDSEIQDKTWHLQI